MPKFRKKPVVIDAIRYDGSQESALEIIHGWAEAWDVADSTIFYNTLSRRLSVQTLEGVMNADAGDWIIRGVKGEFYPCKPDIFEATYDAVLPDGEHDYSIP